MAQVRFDSSHPFAKTKLIYDIVNVIAVKRHELVEDLVAYTNDPVRYQRRLRMLLNLAEYEQQILTKIHRFVTDHPEEDLVDMLHVIGSEAMQVTRRDA